MTKITVFGANGNVGKAVVGHALADGLEVIALVHNHNNLPHHENLTVIKGDIYDKNDIERALAGSDAVISALSSWHSPDKNVLATAMENIIPLMHHHKLRRIISLTGAEARTEGDDVTAIHRIAHFGARIIAGKVLRDGERHIELLAASDLDWLVVRSPIMKAGNDKQQYRLTDKRPLPWMVVNRHAVARAMVNGMNDWTNSQKAVFIRSA